MKDRALAEGVDDRRVEVGPGTTCEFRECLVDADAPVVGAVGRHCLEGVADGDDAGAKRDVLAREAIGISLSVDTLVA